MVLAILVTAGVTSWVMIKKNPGLQWNSAYYYPPQQIAWNFSPGITTMNTCTSCHPVISTIPNVSATSTLPHDHRAICSNCHQVANMYAPIPMATVGRVLTTGIPVIRAGAVSPHADRGTCTNCHKVVNSRGNPIPDIGATSTLPHEDRGICSNCHRLANQAIGSPNMGSILSPIPMAAVGQVVAPAGVIAPSNLATEGEWMGLEVAPITPLTAGQYGIPGGIYGLVIVEAESHAANVGLKAGDVVLSVNGAPISNMTDFFQATQNGILTQGVVEVLRGGQRLAVNIPQPAAAPYTPP